MVETEAQVSEGSWLPRSRPSSSAKPKLDILIISNKIFVTGVHSNIPNEKYRFFSRYERKGK